MSLLYRERTAKLREDVGSAATEARRRRELAESSEGSGALDVSWCDGSLAINQRRLRLTRVRGVS